MEEARAQGTRFASIVISLPNESRSPERFSISRLQCFPKTTGPKETTDSHIESRPPSSRNSSVTLTVYRSALSSLL